MDHEGWEKICQVEKKLLEGSSWGKSLVMGEGSLRKGISEWTDTWFSLITWSFLESALGFTRLGLGLNPGSGLSDFMFLFTGPLGWP